MPNTLGAVILNLMKSRSFYQHRITGEVYVIERSSDGALVASCGPLRQEALADPSTYRCTTHRNQWILAERDKLILMD